MSEFGLVKGQAGQERALFGDLSCPPWYRFCRSRALKRPGIGGFQADTAERIIYRYINALVPTSDEFGRIPIERPLTTDTRRFPQFFAYERP